MQRLEKPWGYEWLWALTGDYAGKILHINAGHQLSLQYHERKDETILLQSGSMILVFENDKSELVQIRLSPGDVHHIPPGRQHRMIAVEDCNVVEVSTSELDDVVRLEDNYGRADR
jgi:mannose-6-phosphate isomerase-like protein (cupin superfamily)